MDPDKREYKNRRVYKRVNNDLTFVSTAADYTPAKCAEVAASTPGKFVVTDMDYTEVCQVYVTLKGRAV